MQQEVLHPGKWVGQGEFLKEGITMQGAQFWTCRQRRVCICATFANLEVIY